MDRRRFFKTFASGVALAAVPTYFLPPSGGWLRSAHSAIYGWHPYPFNIDWKMYAAWGAKPAMIYTPSEHVRYLEALLKASTQKPVRNWYALSDAV